MLLPKLSRPNFNHIDPDLTDETVEMLKEYYMIYHKLHWCYAKLHRKFQRLNLFCNVVAGKAIITSAVAGGITLNPIVFASLTAFGLVVKGVASFKKYDKKTDQADFARIEYKKVLVHSRQLLRGTHFSKEDLDAQVNMLDTFIVDHCMGVPSSLKVSYAERFDVEVLTASPNFRGK